MMLASKMKIEIKLSLRQAICLKKQSLDILYVDAIIRNNDPIKLLQAIQNQIMVPNTSGIQPKKTLAMNKCSAVKTPMISIAAKNAMIWLKTDLF